MTLSDGSRWITQKKDSFRPGARIIVSRCNEDEFWIVNIDQSTFVSAFGSNEACTWLKFEKVKPYLPEATTKE